MKTSIKTFLTVSVCCILTFSLSACGGKSTGPYKSSRPSPSASNEPTTSSSSKPSNSSNNKSNSNSKSNNSSKSKSSDSDDFEDYLKKNDPESYKYYQDLKDGYNSGSYSKENGFSTKSSGSNSKSSSGKSKSSSSKSKSSGSSKTESFENYLKKNDPKSYDYYKGLEKGYSSGSYNTKDGFYKK